MIDMMTMLMAFGFKLTGAVIAFGILRLSLRHLDKVSGFDFKGWIESASADAISIYLAARIIAIAILFAAIM